jgi:hypothetical protein
VIVTARSLSVSFSLPVIFIDNLIIWNTVLNYGLS